MQLVVNTCGQVICTVSSVLLLVSNSATHVRRAATFGMLVHWAGLRLWLLSLVGWCAVRPLQTANGHAQRSSIRHLALLVSSINRRASFPLACRGPMKNVLGPYSDLADLNLKLSIGGFLHIWPLPLHHIHKRQATLTKAGGPQRRWGEGTGAGHGQRIKPT